MFNRIIPAVKKLLTKLIAGLKRFPEAIALTTAVVVIQIFLNHLEHSLTTDALRDILTRISMVLALGVPLFLSLKLFLKRIPTLTILPKVALYFGVSAGLILYYLFRLKDFSMVPITRYIAFSIAFYLTFIFIPYFYKRENFELYCLQLLTNFAVTYCYAVVLYLGLAAILFTISALFFVKFGKLYFDIWLIVAGIFAPSYFLADMPDFDKKCQVAAYPKVLKILILYIIVPLLIAYSLILYVYFAKILITRSWPVGIVSHLVLWYSLISSIMIFFIYPLRNSIKWVPKFLSFYPKSMFPLILMMFVSMGVRIQNYGITENRYFVLIAGLWVTGILMYYLLTKKIRNIILPVSLSLVTLLSVTGPWSSYSISKLSQNNRFAAILTKYDMISGNSITKSERRLPSEAKAEIISILSYFKRFHDLRELKYLPQDFKLTQTEDYFGFKVTKEDLNYRNFKSYFNYKFSNNQPVNVTGYDYFINIPHSDIIKTDPDEKINITYTLEDYVLKVSIDNRRIYRRKVSDLITMLLTEKNELTGDSLSFGDENSWIKLLYVCDSVSGQQNPVTEEIEINYLNFFIFIKLK